ncbi:MAG: recombination regulator RecX [Betaproteobacteria bacterium]
MASGPPLSLTGRALRLLSGREHSRAELQRKLAPHEETPGELAAVLDKLAAKDLQSDQRAVDSLVHRRSAKLGTQRLRQEMQSKGMDPQAVAQAVALLRTSEQARALEVWRKKFGNPATTPAERAKQVRFLAGRGFSGEAIARVISGAFDAD